MGVARHHWNMGGLILSAAAVGCGATVMTPVAGESDAAQTGSDGADDDGVAGGDDAADDTGDESDGAGTTGAAQDHTTTDGGPMVGDECIDASDCRSPEDCIEGYCTCQPYDAYCWYSDDYECDVYENDCPAGANCEHVGGYGTACVEVGGGPECDEAETPVLIPLPNDFGPGPDVVSLAFVDANSDVMSDLLIATSDSVSLHLAPGDAPPIAVPLPNGVTPTSVAGGEFNGDGQGDVAVGLGPDGVAVLLGDGAGGFAPATFGPVSIPEAQAVGAIAFNADAVQDIAVAGEDGVKILFGGDEISTGLVIETLPSVSLAATPPQAGYRAIAADVGDAVYGWDSYPDGDDGVDNAVFSGGDTYAFPLVSAVSDSGYVLGGVVDHGEWSVLDTTVDADFSVPFAVVAATAADLDGDGQSDFLLAGADTLRYYRVSGYNVDCSRTVATEAPGAVLSTGDFSGDGRADVAIASGGAVTVYITQ